MDPVYIKHVIILTKRAYSVRYFSVDPRYFFTGAVVLCVEGIDGKRDGEAIGEAVVALGGRWAKVLSKSVTHVIAEEEEHVGLHITCEEVCRQVLRRPECGIKIVDPRWFDECLKQGRWVEEGPYLFPRGFEGAEGRGVVGDRQDVDLVGKKCLKYKRVLFSNSLGISERLRCTLETVARELGATVVSSVQDANVFIGMYREGKEYVNAARQGITVGNLAWFYWMFVYKTWVKPEQNLLHYPIVRNGLPEMREMVITISNYQGESRQYLEKLIEVSGATFTKNMKPSNTHLIIPCQSGQKYMAALEWNIHIVNHLWIEETYAKWKVQNITTPRYIYFPSQTNFIEMVGNTPIDMDVVKMFYDNKDCDSVIIENPLEEPKLLEYPNSFSSSNDKVSRETSSLSLNIQSTSKDLAFLSINSDNCSTFDFNSSVEENLPSFNKRKAAVIALEKLHNEIMPDVLLYQKECKRKTISDQPNSMKNVRKRSKELSVDHENEENNKVLGASKVACFEMDKSSQDCNIRILVTGYKDWNSQMEKTLSALGIITVQDAKECTHLVAPRIQRTQKFLSALPYAPKILSTDWIKACIKEKKIVDENDYILIDSESEAKYNFKLTESLEKARKNKCSLFKGYLFLISPDAVLNYNNGIDTVKQIIEANGGVCMLATSRRNEIECNGFSLVLISNNLDDKISKQFIEKRKKENQIPLIYNMEWVLTAVLSQELNFQN